MKQRRMNLLFGLGFFLGLLTIIASTTQSAQAETSYQSSPCEEVIADAANRANIIPDEIEWTAFPDENNPWAHCSAVYTWHTDGAESEGEKQSAFFMISRGEGVGLGDRLSCGTQVMCEETTFHGYPAMYYQAYSQGGLFGLVWYLEQNGFTYVLTVERGETIYGSYADVIVEKDEVMEAAESLWSAFDSAVPAASQDPVVTDPGDQPGDDIPTVPVVPIGSDQPGSLGPLATTPLVPLAGALIGTVIGWLVSVAATSGNVLKTLAAPPLKSAQPPAATAGPQTAGLPVAKTPIPPIEVQPPARPAAAPKSGSEHLWDIATNLTGSSAAVTSSLSEYFDFQEDAKTFQKTRDSLQAWKKNPTKEAADAYSKNLRSMTNQNAMLAKAAKVLGNAANVLDGADAVIKGMKKASERGYVGTDYALAVGAEISKKALNYALTKNPVAGLFNAAVGGYSEMVYGKDSRIDLSSIIDKGADAWDRTTQEYAANTGGDWIAPRNENFGDVLANDSELRRKDQYLHGVRQIKKLVGQGKISLKEGGARIRHLRDTLGGE